VEKVIGLKLGGAGWLARTVAKGAAEGAKMVGHARNIICSMDMVQTMMAAKRDMGERGGAHNVITSAGCLPAASGGCWSQLAAQFKQF
jgi:hypothetical protein